MLRAVKFLLSRQAEDGGFHSRTYGLLRSGQSLTPFVLDALFDAEPEQTDAIDRAIAFLERNTNAEGALGLANPAAPDYPNYATALAVKAMVKAKRPGWEQDISRMIAYLRAQQFADENGWKRDDPPYGAWGMGGEVRRPPEPGHVDLSMTRYVLEALAAAGLKPSDPATQKALVFVERCQNPDGGFYFSPVNPDINKAGDTNGKFNSYGTATADGVLALQAAGVDDADRRIRSAKAWLKAHHRPDAAPGFDVPPYQAWAQGLRFYYAAAVSRAMPELPVLLPPQKSDGSWANSSNLVKEDDPLIATALALRVLNHHRGK